MTDAPRACVVANCPALAIDGLDACVVHNVGRRLPKGSPEKRCRRCQQMVKPGEWIEPGTSDDGSVAHLKCPPRRGQGANA